MKEPLRMLGVVPKKEESLKTPRLTIRDRVLCATEEFGEPVAYLLLLDMSAEEPSYTNARQKLAKNGYRTDFAYWTEKGRFRQFIKDIIV